MTFDVRNLDPWLAHHDRHSDPELVVMHATAGSDVAGAVSTLRQKGFSYHVIVPKAGELVKCVPYTKVAYHAGNSYGPREEIAKFTRTQNHASEFLSKPSVNGYSIGISFVNLNDGHDSYTDFQLRAAEWLVSQCKLMYPSSLKWVTTHAIVSPGRKTDPRGYELDALAAACGLEAWRFGAAERA